MEVLTPTEYAAILRQDFSCTERERLAWDSLASSI